MRRNGISPRDKIREFFAACRENISGDIQPEMLEPQIEIATKPCVDFAEARAQLASLRSSVGAVARDFNLSIMASGTHPLAVWSRVRPNAQPRYGKVMHDLQMLGSRNVLCGMHVHVEVPDLGMRVDIMNRIQPYLPLLLALSTSSPFWQAQRTGLLGYRLAAYRELPRTGLAGPVRERAGLPALHRHPRGRPRHREFELCLVGDPAVPEASDPGAARRRQLHAGSTTPSPSPRSIAASCGA